YEFDNLAENPDYSDKLSELRNAHLKWIDDFGDLGAMREMEMVHQWWNGADHAPNTAPVQVQFEDGKLALSSATKSASIGFKKSASDVWSVYQFAFEMAAGDSLYVLAHRIGFEPSEDAMVVK